jgi:hypothetical protein
MLRGLGNTRQNITSHLFFVNPQKRAIGNNRFSSGGGIFSLKMLE